MKGGRLPKEPPAEDDGARMATLHGAAAGLRRLASRRPIMPELASVRLVATSKAPPPPTAGLCSIGKLDERSALYEGLAIQRAIAQVNECHNLLVTQFCTQLTARYTVSLPPS